MFVHLFKRGCNQDSPVHNKTQRNTGKVSLKTVFETEGERQRPGETGISKLNVTFFIFIFLFVIISKFNQ